jgi:F plasmid transfer operon protein TraF
LVALPVLLGLLALPSVVAAQSFNLVGTRARGMGGAFLAVVDDASATWWNPAGLPNSLIVDGVVDFQSDGFIDPQPTPISVRSAGTRNAAFGVGFAFPALGVSYYRVRQSGLEPAIAEAAGGRQDPGTAPLARSLLSQQFGVSLVQSIGDALVVGGTVRLVRGSVATVPASPTDPDAALDAVADAGGPDSTHGDVDLGALLRLSRVRVGLAARNLAAPEYRAEDGLVWRVDRAVRVGVALVGDADRAGRQVWTVACDADLTRERTPIGDRREVAVGVERWIHSRRVGLRGGLHVSTVDEARPAVAGGASVLVTGGLWVEGQAMGGADRASRGWGLSAHVMF